MLVNSQPKTNGERGRSVRELGRKRGLKVRKGREGKGARRTVADEDDGLVLRTIGWFGDVCLEAADFIDSSCGLAFVDLA